MGGKPSSKPEMLGNVPRSNKGKPVERVGDSLWTNSDGGEVPLTGDESTGSDSVSSGTTKVENGDDNV